MLVHGRLGQGREAAVARADPQELLDGVERKSRDGEAITRHPTELSPAPLYFRRAVELLVIVVARGGKRRVLLLLVLLLLLLLLAGRDEGSTQAVHGWVRRSSLIPVAGREDDGGDGE
jgi:hypothetical protein